MSKRLLNLCLSLFLCSLAGAQLNPTTTLAVETGNNTSAADSFKGQTNGNPSGGNVSKVSSRTLLYPGSTTRIFVHFMPWFGSTSHVNVGYSSNDPVQVARQVNDLISRDISGMVIDWYSVRSTVSNATSLLVRDEAAKHPGFSFMMCYDGGALKTATDKTATLISDLSYLNTTYASSPAYLRIGGRPVVQFFSLEQYTTIDWTRVRASAAGNPLFIFRNSSAFSKANSDGGFGWIGVSTLATMNYLKDFYWNANQHPSKIAFGGVYKGFDDSIASWGSHRLTPQNCGQTWLATWKLLPTYFNTSNQLDFIEMNTWNDYEEGTEVETGIDNCVTVAGNVNGDLFSADIVGDPSTIDHYTAFISPDGVNLTVLADSLVTPSIDLSAFTFPNGSYQVYMKAVGKPGLFNHMSTGTAYNLNYISPTVNLSVVAQDPNTSPVRVMAQGVAGSNPITALILYVDGIQVYKTSGAQMDRWICLPTGTHNITVNDWDTHGRSGKTSVPVTVN